MLWVAPSQRGGCPESLFQFARNSARTEIADGNILRRSRRGQGDACIVWTTSVALGARPAHWPRDQRDRPHHREGARARARRRRGSRGRRSARGPARARRGAALQRARAGRLAPAAGRRGRGHAPGRRDAHRIRSAAAVPRRSERRRAVDQRPRPRVHRPRGGLRAGRPRPHRAAGARAGRADAALDRAGAST